MDEIDTDADVGKTDTPIPAYQSLGEKELDEAVRNTDKFVYDPNATGFSWKLLEDAIAAVPGWFHGDSAAEILVDDQLKHVVPGGYLFVVGGNFMGVPIYPLPPRIRRQWSNKVNHQDVWLDKPCFCLVITEQGSVVIGAY